MHFRTKYPDVFGAIYDSMQSCISTKKIASQDKISEILANLMGEIKESFVCCDHSIRIDGPNDKRNISTTTAIVKLEEYIIDKRNR